MDRLKAFFIALVVCYAALVQGPRAADDSRAEIIVDNSDGVGVEVVGSWISTQDVRQPLHADAEYRADRPAFASQHYGVEYLHDRDGGKGAKSVTFTPQLPAGGTYDVYLWWTSGPDRAGNVPVHVRHAEGVAVVRVNQRENGGRWNLLGTYQLNERGHGAVKIETTGTAGRVIADAVRFARQGAARPFPPAPVAPEPVLSIGLHKQLLVDDRVISEKQNLTRALGRTIKVNGGKPVLIADKPWEDASSFGIWATALFDREEKIFKLWYWPQRNYHAYAYSKDGVNWVKPNLGLVDWRGSRENNIIEASLGKHLAVYQDPHERDPAHRYKAVVDSQKNSQVRILHSADGLRWKHYHDGQPVTYRASDFYNQIMWDEARGAYLLTTRTDYGDTGGMGEVRGMRTMINPDVKNDPAGWRTLKSWLLDRPGDLPHRRQIYVLSDQIYEGVHVGLMLVYEWLYDLSEGDKPNYTARHERDILNLYLVTSRDGAHWDTHWIYAGQPLIERGGDGSFDKDGVLPISLVTHGDEHLIYYGGWDERHETTNRHGNHRAVGLAKLKLDRFAGLRAGDQEGTLTTRPFRLEGSRLMLNAEVGGEVRVEVLDLDGRPVRGFSRAEATPLRGVDGLRLEAGWRQNASLKGMKGKLVRLRFHLKNATVYSFGIRH